MPTQTTNSASQPQQQPKQTTGRLQRQITKNNGMDILPPQKPSSTPENIENNLQVQTQVEQQQQPKKLVSQMTLASHTLATTNITSHSTTPEKFQPSLSADHNPPTSTTMLQQYININDQVT